MSRPRPTLLITGASGFIGRHLVEAAHRDYRIIGLSRTQPDPAFRALDPTIEWIVTDIGAAEGLHTSLNGIRKAGGVDYLIHLAGFYDFNYDENPLYERTNVLGTKNVLEEARKLSVKRFIFASSIAACDFAKGQTITEKSPADAEFAYARSKHKGEQMVKEYSRFFPAATVRFAAAFSDWCEYGPLYMFLSTWLTRNWKSRILGGKGLSAIPYIHVNNINSVLLRVLQLSKRLPQHDTYIASPDKPLTHLQLFERATYYYSGKRLQPFLMPKIIASMGVIGLDLLGRLIGHRPFERPWMLRYIDKQMQTDSSYTRTMLDWAPGLTHSPRVGSSERSQTVIEWAPMDRYALERRLLYMIERMKSSPFEWQKKNSKMLKTGAVPPHFLIYEALDGLRDKIVDRVLAIISSPENHEMFKRYQHLEAASHRKDVIAIYQFLSSAIRTRDRMSMLAYTRQLATARFRQGFAFDEVREAIRTLGRVVEEELLQTPELMSMEQLIYDEIDLTFQLMGDELEGTFEDLMLQHHHSAPH